MIFLVVKKRQYEYDTVLDFGSPVVFEFVGHELVIVLCKSRVGRSGEIEHERVQIGSQNFKSP